MPSKPLLVIDSKGKAQPMDQFALATQGLNYWKGWSCWIGAATLNIDEKGDFWRGVCREGGSLGNALSGGPINLPMPTEPIICGLEPCGCAFDYFTPRCKRPENQPLLNQHEPEGTADLSDIVAVKNRFPIKSFAVSWNTGMRCNYDCWYCTSHDKSSKFWTLEQMIPVVDAIHRNIQGRFERIQFQIVGGEPTLNPDLLALCRYAVKLGHRVFIDSNMSRAADYYIELIQIVGHLRFSIHLDYVNPDAIQEKMRELVTWIRENRQKDGFQVSIKYMLQPGKLAVLREVHARFKEIPGFSDHVWVVVSPVFMQEGGQNGAVLRDYTAEEKDFLVNPGLQAQLS